jgi:hypothetical protein
MKKVFSNNELPHVWAHGTQEEGRNTQNSFFFDGRTIYSYGYHFPIAVRMHDNVYLLTTRGYSNTTSKHIGKVWGSIPTGANIIRCYDPSDQYKHSNIDSWKVDINTQLDKMSRAKKPAMYVNEILRLVEQAQAYCDYFGKDNPLAQYTTMDFGVKADELKAISKAKADADKKENADRLAKWRNFETNDLWLKGQAINQDTYLRSDGQTVTTSKGITLPIDVYRRYKSMLPNLGREVLGYRVNSVTDKYVTIGCHNISIKEINSI